MNHLMVDLETMGNGPYAPVISIGAVFFDPNTGETGEEFSVNISLESSMRYRARPDASTILWWLEQSEEARKSLTSNTQELSTALSWLSEFIINNANHKFVQVSRNQRFIRQGCKARSGIQRHPQRMGFSRCSVEV